VQRQHDSAVEQGIPRVLASLPPELRDRVNEELHAMVLGYTSEVFKTIRAVSERRGEEPCQCQF
jgi:hypothetical protein